jgi:hypothetical protein
MLEGGGGASRGLGYMLWGVSFGVLLWEAWKKCDQENDFVLKGICFRRSARRTLFVKGLAGECISTLIQSTAPRTYTHSQRGGQVVWYVAALLWNTLLCFLLLGR